MMRPLVFVIALFLLAPAAYAKPPHVNGVAWIGGLALHFDANRWDVNGAGNAYVVYCKTFDCSGTTIAVTVKDAAVTACTPATLAFDRQPADDATLPVTPGRVDTFSHAGLSFLITEGDFGCRNLAGGPVRACTTYGGKTYVFDAPGRSCRTRPDAGERVDAILQGLKPR